MVDVPAKRRNPLQPAQLPEAERIEQLRLAIEAVEQLLPPAGPEPSTGWPERTRALGAAANAVRELTWSFKPEEWERKWPRDRCNRCQGKGWYWLDPDMSARGWDPCRVCLTTGVKLRLDRWNPARTAVRLVPTER
jgi:hypothetical protein